LATVPLWFGGLIFEVGWVFDNGDSLPSAVGVPLGLGAALLTSWVFLVRGFRVGVYLSENGSVINRGFLWSQTVPLSEVVEIRVPEVGYLLVLLRDGQSRRLSACPIRGPRREEVRVALEQARALGAAGDGQF